MKYFTSKKSLRLSPVTQTFICLYDCINKKHEETEYKPSNLKKTKSVKEDLWILANVKSNTK